jgi:hypothetical protein
MTPCSSTKLLILILYIFQLMVIDMRKTIEEERKNTLSLRMEMTERLEKEKTDRLEKEKEMTERLEKEVEKTNRLEKEMVALECEVKVERNKSSGLEKEMMQKTSRLERETVEKTSKLERQMEAERKKRSVLERDVDDLKQSTNDFADWIVAGVRCISLSVCSFTHPFSSASLKTVVNPSDEFSSVIFWIAFKQG